MKTTRALHPNAVDWLYWWLGAFTHCYVVTVAVLFFTRASGGWPTLEGILGALQEPYLGALGVYVVLKEIRKRRHQIKIPHHGEYFVAVWIVLLIISTALVVTSPAFRFNEVYKIILTNSLATLIIYIGSLIAKP